MNDIPALATSFACGCALGATFYGGLWWTVRKALSSRWAALWFSSSMLARTAVVLLGFFALSHHGWKRPVLCLLGFVASRLVVSRLLSPGRIRPSTAFPESTDAP
jgi:F1F0 ATPase subunit 2